MSGGSSRPTPHRRRVLAVFVGLLAAACTVAPEASEGRSVVAGSTAPALGMVEPEARERGSVAAVLTLGDSTCTLEMSDRPVNGRRIRLHVPEPAPKQTIVDVVRIGDRRSFDDPASSAPERPVGAEGHAGRVRGLVLLVCGAAPLVRGHIAPGPFRYRLRPRRDEAGEGHDRAHPEHGMDGHVVRSEGKGGRGTYAVICFRRKETEWRVLGVAGPVEVPGER